MKVSQLLWGIIHTTTAYWIVFLFLYEILFSEKIIPSILLTAALTMLIRFILVKKLKIGDFNFTREILAIGVMVLTTRLLYF